MLSALKHTSAALAVRGLLLIAFAAISAVMPELTTQLVVAVFGVLLLAAGAVGIASALNGRRQRPQWWWPVADSALTSVVGVVCMLFPQPSVVAFAIVLAAGPLAAGFMQIWAAWKLRHETRGAAVVSVSATLTLAMGGLIAVAPAVAVTGLLWLVALVAFVYGVLNLVLAVRTRAIRSSFRSMQVIRF